MANSNKYEMELYTGSLIKKMLVFAFPLMVTGILQLLYNAADLIVVSRFAGSEALAAVGATGSLTGLMVNFFMGISVGASVCVSRAYGAGDLKELSKAVHTSITVSLIAGIFLAILGNIACRPLLRLMGTPDDVIDGASLYMHILFSGMPANMVYNFGAAILRAVGDTKRPLYFLTIAGICNVLLNLFCVIVLNMSVEGVAIATVASQVISVILVIRCLCVSGGSVRLDFKRLRIHKEPMLEILKMGLPVGLQSSLFAISNVLIQSSVNSFGSIVMAGNAAAGNLEGFVYTGMNAIYQADITFASQNRGAKQYGRMRKVLWISMMLVSIIGIVMGMTFYLCAEPLVSLYNTDPEVIKYGVFRMGYLCAPYFICGVMDVMVGQLRGIGCSVVPMFVSLAGVCAFRVLWVLTVFAANPTLHILYISYPISWAMTGLIHFICYRFFVRKFPKHDEPLPAAV